MWGWIALVGGGALAYAKRAQIESFFKGALPGAGPQYSQPPVGPGGYVAPPAPPGVPPSWTYQGPPIEPAAPTGNQSGVQIAPGNISMTPRVGDTFTASLPAGSQWSGADPDLIPASIGGNVTSDYTSGPSAPLVIAGITGAGTMQLTWTDASGSPQTTMLDVAAS